MLALKKAAVFIVLIGGTLLLTACPSQTNISKINADPDRYRGKEIGIAGTVTDSYGIPGAGAYEIDDGTGKIWVATRRGVPSRGARVGAESGGSAAVRVTQPVRFFGRCQQRRISGSPDSRKIASSVQFRQGDDRHPARESL